jgi:hypothetical protein
MRITSPIAASRMPMAGRRFPLPLLVLVLTLLTVLPALPVHAGAGTWFDLGKRQTDPVPCQTDSTTVESFPPDAFGVFPTGSWVWEDIVEVGCDQLRWSDQVCTGQPPVRAFRIEFSDGGCGCGGYVAIPSTLRLSYDPAVVAARGLDEANLRLAYNDPYTRGWRPVEGALPDLEENAFIFPWSGEILGVREYVILPLQFVPVVPQTWSRIKSLPAE